MSSIKGVILWFAGLTGLVLIALACYGAFFFIGLLGGILTLALCISLLGIFFLMVNDEI